MKIFFLFIWTLSLFAESWSVVYVSSELGLSTKDLKNIYYKKMRQKKGVSLIALNLPSSHPARKAFLQQILASNLHMWDLYYDEMYFMGVKTPPVLESPEMMVKFLFKIEGAVGYIPSSQVNKKFIELAKFEL